MRSTNELQKHPVYAELQLAVSPAQLASIMRLGEFAFKDPLLVTRQGVIIDGYARKEYADSLGISTLSCVELDVSEEEALRVILSKHRRSAGWNDYNRIRMASRSKEVVRRRARDNQQAGGRLKGSSKLTEAHVRTEIAKAAIPSLPKTPARREHHWERCPAQPVSWAAFFITCLLTSCARSEFGGQMGAERHNSEVASFPYCLLFFMRGAISDFGVCD